MHRFISLLLVVSILSSAFSRWMLEAGYEMNRGYIADKLCVNKAKPMLHCNGKCYLAKKIKEEEQGQQKPGTSSKRILAEAFISTPQRFKFFTSLTGEFLVLYRSDYSYQAYRSVFHPPPFLA